MTTAVAPQVLPRGRHALTRAQVRQSQRHRLLRAMTEEVSTVGFAATTAAAVYGRARVSSRAFYENFRDVHDCFLAAYDLCVEVTQTALATEPDGPPLAPLMRLSAMLETYLRLVAAEPAVSRTFLVEVYAAGPEAIARRIAVHRRFVALVTDMLAATHELTAADRVAVAGLVDAITFAVTLRVAARDAVDADTLRADLLGLARRTCPWLTETGR